MTFEPHVPQMITVHCSDTPNGKHASIFAIKQNHIARGFGDIGYHYLIQPSGEIVNGRPAGVEGCHVAGHNRGNLGVCLIGQGGYTRDQWDALYNLVAALRQEYAIAAAELYAHCEWDTAKAQGKTCPNVHPDDLRTWLNEHDARAIQANTLSV